AMKDVSEGLAGANLIPEETADNVDEVKKTIIQNIEWQMSFDRKIKALKSFQGYIWKSGFISGELETVVYNDVIEAMNKWKDFEIKIFIYSSGSVSAQKLLFGHSDKGNLLKYFSGYFDTTIGSKLEKDSYLNIAKHIGVEQKDIVFLSDNVKGFQTAIVDRPNNAPLSDDDRKNNVVFTNFLQIFTHQSYIEPLAGLTSNEAYQILRYIQKSNQNVVHVLTDLCGDNLLTDSEDLLHFIVYQCNIAEYLNLEEAYCDKTLTPNGNKCSYDINIAKDSIDSKITANNQNKELLLHVCSIQKVLDTEKYLMIANALVLSDIEDLDIRKCLEKFLLKLLKEFKVSFYQEKDYNKQPTYLKLLIDRHLRENFSNICSNNSTIMNPPKLDFNSSQNICYTDTIDGANIEEKKISKSSISSSSELLKNESDMDTLILLL
ncbi:19511_t:CDS:2, partial [Gigaspora margarita]